MLDQGDTSVSVVAESEDSLPVMDCTYNTTVSTTGNAVIVLLDSRMLTQ